MVSLLRPHSGKVRVVSEKVGYEFEFGAEAYRASAYARLITAHVPVGTPIIVSDDMAAWAAAASIADRYPMVGVLHGDQDYYAERAQRFQQQMSVCVCVSGRVRKRSLEKCPAIDQQRVFVIPCGVNLPAYQPHTQQNEVNRLIFIGRLTDYEKRAYDLVSICAALHNEGFPFHLDIVGNSEESKVEYAANFAKNGVGEMVTFHGWQQAPQVQQLLNRSDILLLTSNSEGMPLVMMEALASGCGFTGTRVSGIEDYENDPRATDCVSVYTVGDIADAVAKIQKVAAVPMVQRQQAARQLAEAEFSMQVCLDRYIGALASAKISDIQPHTINFSAVDAIRSRLVALARYLKVKM